MHESVPLPEIHIARENRAKRLSWSSGKYVKSAARSQVLQEANTAEPTKPPVKPAEIAEPAQVPEQRKSRFSKLAGRIGDTVMNAVETAKPNRLVRKKLAAVALVAAGLVGGFAVGNNRSAPEHAATTPTTINVEVPGIAAGIEIGQAIDHDAKFLEAIGHPGVKPNSAEGLQLRADFVRYEEFAANHGREAANTAVAYAASLMTQNQ